ncbi:MAG: glycosyltransferase family 4 protein [Minisyncoccia bacterium]
MNHVRNQTQTNTDHSSESPDVASAISNVVNPEKNQTQTNTDHSSESPHVASAISNAMKIVIATPLYPPEIGGPATYAKLLEEGLPGKGIEVELVKFSDVRHLPNAVRQTMYCRNILKCARSADVILALDAVSVGWPVYVASFFLRKKFIVKIVGDHIWEQGTQRFGVTDTLDNFPRFLWRWHPYLWFLRALQLRVARSATRIIVPSEYLKRIVSAWGVPSEKIHVVYNAVTLEAAGIVPPPVAALPHPLVVTAGRLVPWKNIDGVIDAVSGIAGASLVVIGDGPLRAELEKRAQEKLTGRFIFTGALSHKDTLAVMQSADALALNSTYEGLSHLLIESLMLGVPTIATNVGGNPEVIMDGEDGLLVPSNDASALAGALSRVLGDDAFRARLSARAKESSKRFSVEVMLEATVSEFKNI